VGRGDPVHIPRMGQFSTRNASLLATLMAAAALGIALGSEWWGGLVPCALCLLERWPYRVAIGLGLLGLVLPVRVARLMLGLIVLAMFGNAVLAVVHVGVEQHAWPSPLPECAAPQLHVGTLAERLAEMPARPGKPCDAPTYLVPVLPLSMAAMNLIYSLIFAGSLTLFLWNTRGRRR
jgi:disulfide bond formation protein DsbB